MVCKTARIVRWLALLWWDSFY